jgi:hypothetical protein
MKRGSTKSLVNKHEWKLKEELISTWGVRRGSTENLFSKHELKLREARVDKLMGREEGEFSDIG